MRPNPQEATDLVTFTEEILNGKLHFMCNIRGFPWQFVPKNPILQAT